MKKILLLMILSIALISCRRTSINGKLDGMWQLMQKEKVGEGSVDTKEDKIYYSVKLDLISIVKSGSDEYLGRFYHSGDSLFLSEFRLQGYNGYLASKEELEAYGLSDVSERFAVETLSSDKMILKSDYSRLYFRKY